jgi:hypothetical protein
MNGKSASVLIIGSLLILANFLGSPQGEIVRARIWGTSDPVSKMGKSRTYKGKMHG